VACEAPRVVPQLTKVPTAGSDCGVSTTRRAVRWASCGKVRWNAKECRERMGVPAGPTNPDDWRKALEHPATVKEFRKAGFAAPVVRMRGVTAQGLVMGSPISTFVAALEAGRLVCAAESYSVWHGTRWQASDTFTGNHAVSYAKLIDKPGPGGRGSIRYDSLADHRRRGIPRGPMTAPLRLVTDALGSLTIHHSDGTESPLGQGRWAGLTVDRAKRLDAPDKPDKPDDMPDDTTCEDQLAALQVRYDALQDAAQAALLALNDLRALVAELAQDTHDALADVDDTTDALADALADADPASDAKADATAGVTPEAAPEGAVEAG
jgi:hypothetical protein